MTITLNMSFEEFLLIMVLAAICSLLITFCFYQIAEAVASKRRQRRLQKEAEDMEQEYREHVREMSDLQLQMLHGVLNNFPSYYTEKQKQIVEEEIKKRNVKP